jgi:hypothetical protein
VDFVIEHNRRVLPLVVKSGSGLGAKSLHVSALTFRTRRIFQFSRSNFKPDDDFINIPCMQSLGSLPEWDKMTWRSPPTRASFCGRIGSH